MTLRRLFNGVNNNINYNNIRRPTHPPKAIRRMGPIHLLVRQTTPTGGWGPDRGKSSNDQSQFSDQFSDQFTN